MLIKCPECQKEISDKSKQCIHCGCPLDNITQSDNNLDEKVILNYINNDRIAYAIKYIMNTLNISGKEATQYLKNFISNNKNLIQKVDNRPKCPTCQSTNIRKIGSGERVASVVGLGLFSRKINKTWMCNNCKHTW